MRRLPILLVLVLMFALLALVPASADKPNCDPESPDYTEGHPACKTDDTTPSSTTPDCTVELLTGITDTGRVGVECLWTPADEGLTEGTVTVDPSSAVSSLVVFVRDSAPGDICVLEQPGKVDSLFVASFDLFYAPLPEGFVPPYEPYDYEPYVGETYWTWNAPNWCYPQDPIAGPREDLNGTPLVLNVGWIAKKNTTVNVTLSPAQGS